jgi:hypothetical protein
VVSTSRPTAGYGGSVGCRRESRRALEERQHLLEINAGNGKQIAFVLYNRKKSFNDGTGKGDQVTVVQQSATRDIESEMLGGLDAGQSITIPGTSIVVMVCALDSGGHL